MSRVDLIYSSVNLAKLVSVAKLIARYTQHNIDTGDRTVYTHRLVKSIYDAHRIVPSNIGRLTTEKSEKLCLLCGGRLPKRSTVRVLECGHAYHRRCIDGWFVFKELSCPYCKTNVLKTY